MHRRQTSNKNTGLTPENQWNYAVHHWQLTLSEREQKSDATHSKPKQLVVEYTIEDRNVECSVFAVERIPTSGIFYYEVKIESKQWLQVFIGLATEQMKVNEGVGLAERTYAYDSSGLIWGHEVEGCEHGVNDRPYINKGIPFNDGHVVGCGVDLEKGQIFYTKNGEIVIAGLSVDASLLLFPCVSLSELDQKIEANFGPNFLFNPAVIEKLRTGLTPENQWNSAAASCHKDLTLSEHQVTRLAKRKKLSDATHSEPKKLIVEHTGEPWSSTGSTNILDRSVFAVEPIPNSGIFYYEVKIEMNGCLNVYIGLATEQMGLMAGVGLAKTLTLTIVLAIFGVTRSRDVSTASTEDRTSTKEFLRMVTATSSGAAWIWKRGKSFTQ
ncbi:hypothetical protein GPALN_004533 [Globodera pallida]|nr:hypothetical protein GPALN_004533 [Globodera pallida]